MNFINILARIFEDSGFAAITWQQAVMMLVSFVLMYLAIKKQFEPLLLLPIAFGIFLANLPLANMGAEEGGVISVLYQGITGDLFPCLIFMGIGAMTDFAPLMANPVSLLLGASAQLGVYCAFLLALATGLFTPQQAAAIGIIGAADGPTSIFVAKTLNSNYIGAISVAAYSYCL